MGVPTQNRNKQKGYSSRNPSVPAHTALRMFIMQVLASQLPFLANRNAELAVPPLFWPENCIKIGGHVALLSGPNVYSSYCGTNLARLQNEKNGSSKVKLELLCH